MNLEGLAEDLRQAATIMEPAAAQEYREIAAGLELAAATLRANAARIERLTAAVDAARAWRDAHAGGVAFSVFREAQRAFDDAVARL